MGIVSGAMTVRRFRVVGDVPEGFRDAYRERMLDHAFREPPNEMGKEEVEGWVCVQNLLDTDFGDLDRWLFNQYAIFALRVDKKTLPAKLFAAHLAKRCEAWAQEHDQKTCPASVRSDIKDELEREWLRRTLPRVAVTEACWNVHDGYLVLHSLSEAVAERFRKRFFRTFGLKLLPWTPLDWLDSEDEANALIASIPSRISMEERT